MSTSHNNPLRAFTTPVCTLDRHGVITFVNDAWRRFGWENCGRLENTCEGISYLAASSPSGSDFLDKLQHLLAGELTQFTYEYPCHSPHEQRWFSTRFTRFPEELADGSVVLVLHEDISAQRIAEFRQHQVEESAHFGLDHARCVLWSGTVVEHENGDFQWDIQPSGNETALRFLPIAIHEGSKFSSSLWQARLDDDRQASDLYAKCKIRAGESYSQEYRIRLRDGSLKWIKDDVAVHAAGESQWKLIGTWTDITEQKQAQLDVKHLMSSARCLVWHALVVDEYSEHSPERGHRWKIKVVNEEAAERFFPVERAPGEDYTDAWINSRLSEEWDALHNHARDAINNNRDYSQEFRNRGIDGQIFWMKEDVQVEVIAPRCWRLSGVCTDITALKHQDATLHDQEQHFRLALEGGNLGSWHLDIANEVFIHASERTKELFGTPRNQSLQWQDFIHAVVPEDRPLVMSTIHKALKSHQYESVEYRVCHPDGKILWISAHGHSLDERNGYTSQLIGIVRDITEQKRLEETRAKDLQLAKERADRDPLTNLLNHRAFHKRLEEETYRAHSLGQSLTVMMLDIDNFKFFNDVYGHTVGDYVLCQVAQRLQAIACHETTLSRFGGDEFALILPLNFCRTIAHAEERLRSELQFSFHPDGYPNPIPITISLGVGQGDGTSSDWMAPLHLADQRLRHAKTGGATQRDADEARALASKSVAGFSMLDALVTAVDNKDRYTKRHSEDVMRYSVAIAQEVGSSEDIQNTIAAAALLHDVGKIGVPDAILRKPGALTSEEAAAIQLHPTMGAAIVGAVVGLEGTLDAVRYHHERWDGKGYPSGLVGEEIPWIARLMAVADAYSAMTTDRPYRIGMSPERAQEILQEGAGTQWDPVLVAAFLRSQHPAHPRAALATLP